MTKQHPITPPPGLKEQALKALEDAPGPDYPMVMTILDADQHASYGSSLPAAYRLVMMPDGNGNDVPVLQGYYAWVGASPGGEWRSLETQDGLYADDKIPHPSLP